LIDYLDWKKEVKFVAIENFVGAAESEILEWKSSLTTE